MKWVKVAIGVVIAVAMVGIISTSVYNMTQETMKDAEVTFEVLTETTITSGTYSLIEQFVVLDINDEGTNVKSIKVNNIELEESIVVMTEPNTYTYTVVGSLPDSIYDFMLYEDDTIAPEGYEITVGDVWVITFDFEVTQPPQLTGIIATLLLLTPLIFVGGVLAFMLNKQEF